VTAGNRARPLDAIDEVEVVGQGRLRAVTRIVVDPGYLAAHYPGRPIYPGVFVLESALQALERVCRVGSPQLTAVRMMRMLAPIEPPATLVLDIALRRSGPASHDARVHAIVGDRAVADLALALEGMDDAPIENGPH
jgi:3-hydroxyacyl-[acyl-carrier-protein] dehydratase